MKRALSAIATFLAVLLLSAFGPHGWGPRIVSQDQDRIMDSGAADSGVADSGADAGSSDVDSGADTGADTGADAGSTDADAGISGDTGPLQVVIQWGQSLSMGGPDAAGFALSTSQPYSLQRVGDAGTAIPLLENRDQQNGGTTPAAESPLTGMMAEAVKLGNAQSGGLWWDAVGMTCARSGGTYNELMYQGAGFWDAGSYSTGADAGFGLDSSVGTGYVFWRCEQALTNLVSSVSPRSVVVKAFVANHAEADTYGGNTQDYASYMADLQGDVNTRFKSITGQTVDIPIVQMQTNSAPAYDNTSALMAQAQLRAAFVDSGVYVATPKTYWAMGEGADGGLSDASPVADTKHASNTTYRSMGERVGAWLAEFFQAGTTHTLRPSSASIDGSVMTINYSGCTAPIVLEQNAIGRANLDNEGFRVHESGGVTISSVGVDGGCAVDLVGSAAWKTGTLVSYAYGCPRYSSAGDAGADAGVTDAGDDRTCEQITHGGVDGMRGSVHDSWQQPSWHGGAPIDAWSVAFGPEEVTPSGGATGGTLENTYSLAVDGAGDYISAASASDINCTSNHASWCWWYYSSSVASAQGIISKGSSGHAQYSISYTASGSQRILFALASANNTPYATNFLSSPTSVVTTGAWHSACVMYDGSQETNANRARFGHDGTAYANSSAAGTMPTSIRDDTGSMTIGRTLDGAGAARDLNGYVDNVAMWCGTSLTDTDFATWHNSGVPRTPVGLPGDSSYDSNLKLWMRLGEGYKTSAGYVTGTPEGFAGKCSAVGGSAQNWFCETIAAAGDWVSITSNSVTGTYYNSASGATSRFNPNGDAKLQRFVP